MADLMHLVQRALVKAYSLWLKHTYPFASIGKRVSIHFTCDLPRSMASAITIGDSVLIAKDVWLNVEAAGDEMEQPSIVFEDGCVIARRSTISAKNCIHLEKNVILAASVLIMDHNHAFEDVTFPVKQQGVTNGGRIRIGEGCWIGHGAAILCDRGDVTIGRNSVIAANAVVTRSCPDFSVLAGNPARIVKQFDLTTNAWVLGSVRSARTREEERSAVLMKD